MIEFTMILAIGIFALAIDAQRYDLKPVEWVGGDFDWPCETTRRMFKTGGRYVSKNVIATRAVVYRDKAIVTLPRFKRGVPGTLAIIPLRNKPGIRPSLQPYPSWSLQEEGNCAALQSAVDVFLDPRAILWVLDSGVVNSLEEPTRTCPPKVVAINVKTGKIVRTIVLDRLTSPESRLQYIIADHSDDNRALIYITDAASRAIIVYDVTSARGYRLILPKIVTTGCEQPDVLYFALLRRSDRSSYLVFTYLCSDRIFTIPTNNLPKDHSIGRIHEIGRKSREIVLLGNDNGTIVFFRYAGESDLYSWDTTKNFVTENLKKIFTGTEYYLTTDVMIDNKRGRVRILQSNFPDFYRGTVGRGIENAIIAI